jgi:tartronate-semialdehyde synthase
MGCKALRVFEPDGILPALEQAKKLMAEFRVPVVVEIVLERITNIAMGTDLDNVVEFEPLALSADLTSRASCRQSVPALVRDPGSAGV